MITDLEVFEAWLKPRVTWNSCRTYMSILSDWSVFLDGNPPTKETAEGFLSYKKQEGTLDSSLSYYMAVLKRYLAWKGISIEYTLPELVQARAKQIEYKREYYRKGYIGQVIGGKLVMVPAPGKRTRPEVCELCGRVRKLLYHHWDDENYSRGLWLCLRCHNVAEAADVGVLSDKYLDLKRAVDKEAMRTDSERLHDRLLELKSRLNGDR